MDTPAEPGRLTIIGTGHVFRIAPVIRAAIQAARPEVVFVELDRGRFEALRHRQRGGTPPAGGGFIQKRLQAFQEGVAGMYGASVGEEMLAAVDGARDVGAKVAFVDPPAEDTVRRALKALTWRERLRIVGLAAKGGLDQVLPRRRKGRADLEDEIRRYQEDPERALEELRETFPTLHRIVIQERDERMAAAIRAGMAGHRSGLAVVGDGHVPGMLGILGGLVGHIYRLDDVRRGDLPRPELQATGPSQKVSFGFSVSVGGPPQKEAAARAAPDARSDPAAGPYRGA